MTWNKYKLAPITSFRIIQETAEEAHHHKQLIIIIGATGYGKSIGFNHYIKNKDNCYYAKIKPAEAAKPFFCRFIDIINDRPADLLGYHKNTYLNWLIEESSFELIGKKDDPFLIIDEAGNFKKNAQSYLRQLWDNISGSSGMIISGPERYKLNLHQWNQDLSSGIPEFVSRINNWVELPEPSYDDIKLICSTNEIEEKKVIKHIYEKSLNLRNVKNYVTAYHNGTLEF